MCPSVQNYTIQKTSILNHIIFLGKALDHGYEIKPLTYGQLFNSLDSERFEDNFVVDVEDQ